MRAVARARADRWSGGVPRGSPQKDQADKNPAAVDPNFQSWAHLVTDAEGRYRIKPIKPGHYPVREGWSRPPHIHFKVACRGYSEITTQMYFAGDPLNDVDLI